MLYVDEIYDYHTDVDVNIQLQEQEYVANIVAVLPLIVYSYIV